MDFLIYAIIEALSTNSFHLKSLIFPKEPNNHPLLVKILPMFQPKISLYPPCAGEYLVNLPLYNVHCIIDSPKGKSIQSLFT